MTRQYLSVTRKLQRAINKNTDCPLLINIGQWYSEDKGCPITVYTVKQACKPENGKKRNNIVIFKTYSQLQLLLFFRDYWYKLNGWEVPTDNEKWETIKVNYVEAENIEQTKRWSTREDN